MVIGAGMPVSGAGLVATKDAQSRINAAWKRTSKVHSTPVSHHKVWADRGRLHSNDRQKFLKRDNEVKFPFRFRSVVPRFIVIGPYRTFVLYQKVNCRLRSACLRLHEYILKNMFPIPSRSMVTLPDSMY